MGRKLGDGSGVLPWGAEGLPQVTRGCGILLRPTRSRLSYWVPELANTADVIEASREA